MFQSWGAMIPGAAPVASEAGSGQQDSFAGLQAMNDLVRRSMESLTALVQPPSRTKSAKGATDSSMLTKLFDPAEWSRAMTSGIDASLQRMTEAPTYATPVNLDRKVSNAQRLWLERAKDIQAYQQVVQAAWNRAFEDFTRKVNDPKAPPLSSGRAILDLWLGVANEALLQMHHRPEFLEAQRRMARSGAEYRLQEQELAEVFCAAHHIPTRTEMDEVQRTMHELKRELRALKRQIAAKGKP